MSDVDLDDTSRCPVGPRCDTCGSRSASGRSLAVATTPVGVVRLTLCSDCREAERLPRLDLPTAVARAGAHCAHLGIDVDVMAELMRGEGEGS